MRFEPQTFVLLLVILSSANSLIGLLREISLTLRLLRLNDQILSSHTCVIDIVFFLALIKRFQVRLEDL